MMNTNKYSAVICSELFAKKGGVTVVISPGSRNAPLTIAFQKSAGWGLSVLLIFPVGAPLFLITHWKEASYWFYGMLIGGLLIIYL